jgi:GTP cyclohydrolase I
MSMWTPGKAAEAHVVGLLTFIGEDPSREGLRETPLRVLKAWREMTSGYSRDPAEILAKSFPTDDTDSGSVYDGMVVQKNIPLRSTCEHHMMPFTGVAHVAYIPRKRVAGLSKLARLVDCFGLRLQVQERLTTQIADALMDHLDPLGAACIVEATHSCMCLRGVLKHGTTTRTATMRGLFMKNASVKNELLFHLSNG